MEPMNVVEYWIRARDETAAVVAAAKNRMLGSTRETTAAARQAAAAEQQAMRAVVDAESAAETSTRSLTSTLVLFGKEGGKIPKDLAPMQASLLETTGQMHGLERAFMRIGMVGGAVVGVFTAVTRGMKWLATQIGDYKTDAQLEEIERKWQARKKAVEATIDANAKLEDTRIEQTLSEFQRLAEDADNAAAAIEKVAAAKRKVAELALRREMTDLDLQEQAARRTTGGDDLLEKRIDVLWGAARRDAETRARIAAADAETEAAQRQVAAATTIERAVTRARQEAEFMLGAAEQALTRLNQRRLALGKRPTGRLEGEAMTPEAWAKQDQEITIATSAAQHTIQALEARLQRDRGAVGAATATRAAAQASLEAANMAAAEARARQDVNAQTYAAEAEAFNRAIDERAAKETAEAQKLAAEQMRLDTQRYEEQRKLAIDTVRAQERAESELLGNASDRMRRAETEVARTWSWYKDKTAWKGELQAEREDAAAQVQFQKDAERLQGKFQWRTSNLSDEEEIVRRVLFAREEEAAARQALLQIEQNTRDLAAKVEALMALR
jgi:hypothetical protein